MLSLGWATTTLKLPKSTSVAVAGGVGRGEGQRTERGRAVGLTVTLADSGVRAGHLEGVHRHVGVEAGQLRARCSLGSGFHSV